MLAGSRLGNYTLVTSLRASTLTMYSLFAVTASAQELVITCYQRDRCLSSGSVFEGVSIQACCDNVNGGGLDGIGLGASYQLDGIEGCTPCPVG